MVLLPRFKPGTCRITLLFASLLTEKNVDWIKSQGQLTQNIAGSGLGYVADNFILLNTRLQNQAKAHVTNT